MGIGPGSSSLNPADPSGTPRRGTGCAARLRVWERSGRSTDSRRRRGEAHRDALSSLTIGH